MVKDRIRELRLETGMTQDELAPLLGIVRGTLTRYEDGSRLPSYDRLCAIADYFHVSTDWLLCRTDRREPYERKA